MERALEQDAKFLLCDSLSSSLLSPLNAFQNHVPELNAELAFLLVELHKA